jgi:hypothetical protein
MVDTAHVADRLSEGSNFAQEDPTSHQDEAAGDRVCKPRTRCNGVVIGSRLNTSTDCPDIFVSGCCR